MVCRCVVKELALGKVDGAIASSRCVGLQPDLPGLEKLGCAAVTSDYDRSVLDDVLQAADG